MSVPPIRIRSLNARPENARGGYVLYWMIAARRAHYNFALQHAADRAAALGLPLLVVEPIGINYPWASNRFHHFVVDGMRDNHRAFQKTSLSYYSYVEPRKGAGKGLLTALSKNAAITISDDSTCAFVAKELQRAATEIQSPLELVDGNGLYPLRATQRVFTTAASFRRHLQKELPEHLAAMPQKSPLARRGLKPLAGVDSSISKRWPELRLERPPKPSKCDFLPGSVSPVAGKGGHLAAQGALAKFMETSLPHYLELRNQPSERCQSYLSPYLHFGHISAQEIFLAVVGQEDWSPSRLAERATGSRTGWWGTSPALESFLDQLITWREIGHNMAAHDPAHQAYESLPPWAQSTLDRHASDPREHLYSLEELEEAKTHDPIWNAAQTQLLLEGTIHNYLRMLWGKKILEWSPDPRTALEHLVELNNKYALDGRDANSYSGIFWTLGRYDRAWGPERPIFGKVRYMSSANTARKLKLSTYLAKYSGD